MIRKTIIAIAAAAAVAAPVALVAPAQATAPSPKPTIADVLLSDKAGDDANGFDRNWYDFDIVTQAVLNFPALVSAAQDPNATLTVFAPNDRAFQVLVKELTGKWQPTEGKTYEALVNWAVETAGSLEGGLELINTVLTYHIVGSKISASDALKSDGETLTTLQGGTFEVDVVSKRFQFIVLKDQDPNDLNPWIVRSKFNVGGELSNGYIHGIGLVLRPVPLP
jgi:uncharacterized surface protein with fasciclin (FAS1) repeats